MYASLPDSPPTRRQPSRWQQLKAGWAEGDSITAADAGGDQDEDSYGNIAEQLVSKLFFTSAVWNGADQQTANLVDDAAATDVLKCCAELRRAAQHLSFSDDASSHDANPKSGTPGVYSACGTSSAGAEVPVAAASSLLAHLQADPISTTYSGAGQTPPCVISGPHQEVDVTGVFDYLQQQQQHQPLTTAGNSRSLQTTVRTKPVPKSVNARTSRQPSTGSNTASSSATRRSGTTGTSSIAIPCDQTPTCKRPLQQRPKQVAGSCRAEVQTARTAAGQRGVRPPITTQHTGQAKACRHSLPTPSTAAAGGPAAGAGGGRASRVRSHWVGPCPAHAPATSTAQRPGSSTRQDCKTASDTITMGRSFGATAPAAHVSAGMRSPATTTGARSMRTPLSSAVSKATVQGAVASCQQQAAPSASAAAAPDCPGALLQELSSSSSHSLRECQAELHLELAAALMYRLLRRWQLAAADAALDKARARPMCNLLCKRKAMRAWRLALSVGHSPQCNSSPKAAALQQCWQPLPLQPTQQQQRQRQQVMEQPGQQCSRGSSRHMQVASQFHRLYRLHSCLLHWRAWAPAVACLRQQQQRHEQLVQHQQELAQQQEEMLAEFHHRQQQELQQQQERKCWDVAVRFHQLYILHSALRTWHKHASVSAALNRLHTKRLTPPSAIADAAGHHSRSNNKGSSSCAAAAAGSTSDRRALQGGLDPAVVQEKVQQMLHHLANRHPADTQQQQQQQPVALPIKGSKAVARDKERKASRQHQGLKAGHAEQNGSNIIPTGAGQPALQLVAASSSDCVYHQGLPQQQLAQDHLMNQSIKVPSEGCTQQQPAADAGVAAEMSGTCSSRASAAAAGHQAESTGQQASQDALARSSNGCTGSGNSQDLLSAPPSSDQQGLHVSCEGAAVRATCAAAEAGDSDHHRQQQTCPLQQEGGPELATGGPAACNPSTSTACHSVAALSATSQQWQQDLGQQLSVPEVDTSQQQLLCRGAVGSNPDSAEVSSTQQQQQQHQQQKQELSEPHAADKQQQQSQANAQTASGAQVTRVQQLKHQSRQRQRQQRQPQCSTGLAVPQQGTACPDLSSHEQQHQQQWVQERQRLQQHIRQLQAEEQRRHRQQQQVEQQLQALLCSLELELAVVHSSRALVRRAGVGPWLSLMALRSQQQVLAGRVYQWHLLTGAIGAWKQALLCRYKRHTCRHIQAWGVLRSLRQQQQRRRILQLLGIWAHTGQHYRRSLLARCMAGWRGACAEGAAGRAAAAEVLRELRQRQVLREWWQYVQDQVHAQLLVEVEMTPVAAAWRENALRRQALSTWRTAAAAAARDRQQETARQHAWRRVRGWLTELEHSSAGTTPTVTAAAAAAVTAGAAAGPGLAAGATSDASRRAVSGSQQQQTGVHTGGGRLTSAAVEVDSSIWGEAEGLGADVSPVDWETWGAGHDGSCGVGEGCCDSLDGLLAGGGGVCASEMDVCLGAADDSLRDLEAMGDWFERDGSRSLEVLSECSHS